MNRNKLLSKRVISGIFFLTLFTVGTILIFTVPFNVKITYGLSVHTDDGVVISFNLFEPAGRETESKPAVIIGHGVMANKEFMKGYAIEIAAAGFVAVALDFRGHGQSTGELETSKLIHDVNAIINFLNTTTLTTIDMNRLAYVGYSMGGGPGNIIVNTTNNFQCFVGVGTMLDVNMRLGNSTNPLNVLMINARFDEAITLETLKASMAPRVGKTPAEVDVHKLYGSFENGNASKIYLDDNSEHLMVAWDQDFIREARNWIINTFSDIRAIDENFYANLRFFILVIQLIGGLGLFFVIIEPLSKLILKSKNKEEIKTYQIAFRNTSKKNLVLKTLLYSLSIVLPLIGMGIVSPLLLTPLNIVALVIMIFFGQAFAFLVLLWRTAKKEDVSLRSLLKEPFKDKKSNLLRQFTLGAILTIILYVILYLSVGLNYFGMIPSVVKLPWMFLYYPIFFVISLITGILIMAIILDKYEDNVKSMVKLSLIAFGFLATYTVFYILLFCLILRNYFFLLFIMVILPVLLLTACVLVVTYSKTGSLIAGTTISAFLHTCISITLSPLAFGLLLMFMRL